MFNAFLVDITFYQEGPVLLLMAIKSKNAVASYPAHFPLSEEVVIGNIGFKDVTPAKSRMEKQVFFYSESVKACIIEPETVLHFRHIQQHEPARCFNSLIQAQAGFWILPAFHSKYCGGQVGGTKVLEESCWPIPRTTMIHNS